MNADETNDDLAPETGEPMEPSANPESDSGPSEPITPPRTHQGWRRRTFLQAAALGTAAAALLNKEGPGLRVGPLPAIANDLGSFPCTANDQNVGAGTVVNAPCTPCTGAFDAIVQFPVQNGSGTNRYCVALHLPAVTVGGTQIAGQDVILYTTQSCAQSGGGAGCTSSSSPKATIPMYGKVLGFPCNATTVTFTGATVAWNTSTNAAGCTTADQSPPKGQCEHQTVTINAFNATLDCTSNCTPSCGGNVTLHACATNAATVASGATPFKYVLTGTDGTNQTYPASGGTADSCHDFDVAISQSTAYTVQIFDSRLGASCYRQAQKSLSISPFVAPTPSATAGPDCGGSTTLSVTNASSYPAGVTYTWTNTNNGITTTLTGSGSSITVTLPVGDNTISVTVSNGVVACQQSGTTAVHVNGPVATRFTAPGGTTSCDGKVTLNAAASGGNGSFTFAWKLDGNTVAATSTSTTSTLNYGPIADGACHTVTVVATDTSTNKCQGNVATTYVTQCIHTAVSTSACPAAP